MMWQELGRSIRKQFAAYNENPQLVYFDSAATALKPACVIEAMAQALGTEYGTVHRGVYTLAKRATERFELARQTIAAFVGEENPTNIVFCRGTTDAINLVAHGLISHIKEGDEIVLTILEHHSNLIPWQMLAHRTGAVLRLVPAAANGILDQGALQAALNPKTRIFATAHMSNTTGILQDLKPVLAKAKSYGAWTLLDGAQAIASSSVKVQDLGCDFYAFSSHKLYGPTGFGVLWGRKEALESLTPRDGGGEMVDVVGEQNSSYADLPLRLEAGTPPIAEAVCFAKALEFLQSIDRKKLLDHKIALSCALIEELETIGGVRVFAKSGASSLVLFHVEGVHPLDLTHFLDLSAIAIRSGHMCAQLALKRLGLESALRASFGIYSDFDEIEKFITALKKVLPKLR